MLLLLVNQSNSLTVFITVKNTWDWSFLNGISPKWDDQDDPPAMFQFNDIKQKICWVTLLTFDILSDMF